MSEPAPALGTKYALTVQSQNSKVSHFALFQTLPTLVGTSKDALSLAWMVGTSAPGSINNAATSTFEWTIDYSVVAGYIQNQGTPEHPRRFSTQCHKDVMLESHNMLQVVASPDADDAPGVPYFPAEATDGDKGEVQIHSDGSIPTDDEQKSTNRTLTLGLAMDTRVAVAVELVPNILHQFTPHPTYYIVAGSFIQGQVVDTAMTTMAFPVQFGGVTKKTIIFDEKNGWSNA